MTVFRNNDLDDEVLSGEAREFRPWTAAEFERWERLTISMQRLGLCATRLASPMEAFGGALRRAFNDDAECQRCGNRGQLTFTDASGHVEYEPCPDCVTHG